MIDIVDIRLTASVCIGCTANSRAARKEENSWMNIEHIL